MMAPKEASSEMLVRDSLAFAVPDADGCGDSWPL